MNVADARPLRWWTGATMVVLAAAMLVALPAIAEGRWRLVLVSEPDSELAHRLRAEAADVGLELAFETASSATVLPSAIAERHGAVGVIRVSSPTTVEIWIRSGDQRPTNYETIRGQPSERQSFAFRVIEEVRARLTKLRLPERDPRERRGGAPDPTIDAAPTSRADAPGAPSDVEAPSGASGGAPMNVRALAAGAGVAASAVSGGMGPTLYAALALRVTLTSGWGAAAHAFVPLTVDTVSAPEGSGDVRAYLVAGEIARDVWARAPWSAALGAGAGALILTLEGNPATGYVARDDRLTAAIFVLQAHLKTDITPWFSIRGALLGGATAPRPVVRFAGRDVAAWGRPFAVATLTLDFVVPVQ
jgi:hypothetical protein